MNRMKRLLFPLPFIVGTDGILQVTSCKMTFNTGCLPLIRQQITILFRKYDLKERERGFSGAVR